MPYLDQAEGKVCNFFATLVEELNDKLNILTTDVALPCKFHLKAHAPAVAKATIQIFRYSKSNCLSNIRQLIQIKYPRHCEWDPGFEIRFP